jgi:hypothetical protein
LEFSTQDNRYYCGLVRQAERDLQHSSDPVVSEQLQEKITLIKAQLHIGAGCCSPLNSDRIEKVHKARQMEV